MADFKTLNGYNVKDEVARNSAATVQDNLDNAVETLTHKIENATQNKVILITDSYGDGYSPDGNTTSFSEQLLNNHVIDYNLHAGGSGFVNAGTTERGNFQTQLTLLTQTLTEEERNKVNKIVIVGGVNDGGYDISDIKSAMASFKTYANTNYPNAELLVGFISYVSSVRYENNCRKVLPTYSSASGFTYIKNAENILYSTNLLASDLIHPNQDGQNYLAVKLTDGIINGAVEIFEFVDNGLQITNATGFTVNYGQAMPHIYVKNGEKIMNLASFTVTFTGTQTITYNGLEVGTWSSPVIKSGIRDFSFKTTFVLRNPSNNQFFSANGIVLFRADGKLLLAVREGSGSGFYEPQTNIIRLDDITGNVTTLNYPYY